MRHITMQQRLKYSDRDVLVQVLNAPPKDGYSLEAMRVALRLLDKIEAGNPLTLEDAEWDFLHRAIQRFPFAFPHRDFLDLADSIAASPQQ